MFGGLRQENLIYILDKNNLELKVGQVTSVSNPMPKYNKNNTFPAQPFTAPEMEIEVKAKVKDEEITLKELPANSSITCKNNIVVTDNREAMNGEVEAMIRNSRVMLESVPYHQKVLDSCDIMLRELNPQFAKEKEQEEKISALEGRMGDIDGKLEKVLELLSDTIGQNKNKKNKEE